MRRDLGMHRSSTTSALEPSASVISLCQSSSFGHAQSCTGCVASPQFVRSRNRSGEPRHDHPHELASLSKGAAWRLLCQRGSTSNANPPPVQMRRFTVCRCTGPGLAQTTVGASRRDRSVLKAEIRERAPSTGRSPMARLNCSVSLRSEAPFSQTRKTNGLATHDASIPKSGL
jgi:hypothetical protein